MRALYGLAARSQRTVLVLGFLALVAWAAAGILWLRPDPAEANPLAGMAGVAAGNEHTCALTAAGGVSCWGSNSSGQLGDGTSTSRGTPREVLGLSGGVAALTAGGQHTCALTTAGGVKCWGLGFGSVPTDIAGLGTGVAGVAAGGNHTCAITATGGVKCWGDNLFGQLGDGTEINRASPVDVLGLESGVARVAAGAFHTCAVTSAGTVKCWGRNQEGQLGDGQACDNLRCPAPVDVPGFGGDAAAVAAGGWHTCAVTAAGNLRCWGDNSFGQLGDGTTTGRTTPVDVLGVESDVAEVSGGGFHTCAVTTAGGVKCWGQNFDGQLGDGTGGRFLDTVVDVVELSGGIGGLGAGDSHTCAVTTAGDVRCFGSNRHGQLGGETTEECRLFEGPCSDAPIQVSGLDGNVATVSGGGSHTCALTTGSGAKCWGDNGSGQLGNGTYVDETSPVDVSGLSSAVGVIAAGSRHTCAVTTAGGAKCWGANRYGQLGNGTTTGSATPVDVSGLTGGGAGTVDAGDSHTCAVTTAGGATCWGSNGYGQLGAITTEDCDPGPEVLPCSTVPVAVTGLGSGVAAIAGGGAHTCALTAAGGVKCWGNNSHGQLGDGTIAGGIMPVDVSGLTSGVAAIVAGWSHTCALTTAGGVKCWGNNGSGQMGDGSAPFDSLTPVTVPGLSTGVVAIAAGGAHTCALTTAGGVKCWGSNETAQLGVGANVFRTSPVSVVGLVPKPTPTHTPCPPEGCPTPVATPTLAPQTGLDFSVGIDVDGDTSNDCDTRTGPLECSAPFGSTFALLVSLESLPAGVQGYGGFDIVLEYAGVSSKNDANAAFWPDCWIPAAYFEEGFLAWGCTTGISTPISTYTGPIGANHFNCTQSGSITMVHGYGYTVLYDSHNLGHFEGEGTTETITVNCVERPTPSPTPSAQPPPPVGGIGVLPDVHGAGGPDGGAGVVVNVAFALTAGAVALGGVAWHVGRRRQRSGLSADPKSQGGV